MRRDEPVSDAAFLAGVAGVLFDVDGVLRIGRQVVPGAIDVLGQLSRAGVDFCLSTNNSTHSRRSLLLELKQIGLAVPEDRLLTAATATASWTAEHHAGKRCMVLVERDALEEFKAAGVDVVPEDDPDPAEVVVMGGAGDHFTYARLNLAFRSLLAGAAFVAVHRNVTWRTETGLSIDSGPFVSALEQATGASPAVVGKPSVPFFEAAIARIGQPPASLVMVGDDVEADVMPARALGMKTALVRTGKPTPEHPPSDLRSITMDSVASLDWSTLTSKDAT